MGTAATRTRENRTITVDFREDATYVQLIGKYLSSLGKLDDIDTPEKVVHSM